jgi:hypothetical protein
MGEGEHLVMGILWIAVGAGGIYRAQRGRDEYAAGLYQNRFGLRMMNILSKNRERPANEVGDGVACAWTPVPDVSA